MRSIHDALIQETQTKKLVKLFNLKKRNSKEVRKASRLELFQWIALHERNVRNGAFYDDVSLQLRHGRNSDEGVGHSELAIRHMLGLELNTNGTTSSLDIKEENYQGEIKEVQGTDGAFIEIKLNKNAREAWNDCRRRIQEHPAFSSLNSELLRSIERGELACGTISRLPLELKKIIDVDLDPVLTMRHERRMYCGAKECYVVIENDDYRHAWIKPHVTMGGCIKYSLSRRYLVLRILRLLARPDFESIEIQSRNKRSERSFVVKVNERSFEHDDCHMRIDEKEYSLRNVISSYERLFKNLMLPLSAP